MAPNSERAVHHKMATFQADKPIGHSVAYRQSLEEFEYGFIQPHYQRIVEKKKKVGWMGPLIIGWMGPLLLKSVFINYKKLGQIVQGLVQLKHKTLKALPLWANSSTA